MIDIDKVHQALYAKRKKSRKAAIRCFCLFCCGGDVESKQEVKLCTDSTCPLYSWRLTG